MQALVCKFFLLNIPDSAIYPVTIKKDVVSWATSFFGFLSSDGVLSIDRVLSGNRE